MPYRKQHRQLRIKSAQIETLLTSTEQQISQLRHDLSHRHPRAITVTE